MTGEVLTLIVIIAGMAATVAIKRENSMMGMVGGIEGRCQLVMVHRPSKMKGMEWVTDPLDRWMLNIDEALMRLLAFIASLAWGELQWDEWCIFFLLYVAQLLTVPI
jgi:hypothetical protein